MAVEKNKKLVRLQKAKLNAELGRLHWGRSNSDLIIRFEDDVLNARLELARSYCRLRKALVDLSLSKHTLLKEYKIKL